MRTLAGTLCSLSLFATFGAEATLIERSVDLDLLQVDISSRSFETTLDFDDVVLGPGERLALDVHFVNGRIGVFVDPTAAAFPTFYIALGSPDPLNFFCCRTATLLETDGELASDTLTTFEMGGLFDLVDSFQHTSFTYGGLRLEAEFPSFPNTVVSSLHFRQSFAIETPSRGAEIYLAPVSVPEPGTLSLLSAGLLSLILARRRSRITG